MPRLKSAIKRVRISSKRRLSNLAVRSAIKTSVKKVKELVDNKDLESANKAKNEAFSLLDRAARKRLIHPNKASRKKSSISKWIKTLEPKAS